MNLRKIFDSEYKGNSFEALYDAVFNELMGMCDKGDVSFKTMENLMLKHNLVNSEYGETGHNGYTIWSYEEDPNFGQYGAATLGIYVEHEWELNEDGTMYIAGEIIPDKSYIYNY